MYRWLVVTDANAYHFQDEEFCEYILPFVQHLRMVVVSKQRGAQQIIDSWIPPLGATVDVRWDLLRDLLERLDMDDDLGPRLCGVTITYASLPPVVTGGLMPRRVAEHLTHVDGYISGAYEIDKDDESPTPEAWARAMLQALPLLQHFGLRIVSYYDKSSYWPNLARGQLETTISDTRKLLHALLDCRPTLRIVVRIGGQFSSVVDEENRTRSMLAEFDDRLKVWSDPKPLSNWLMEEQSSIKDMWHGHDIFTGPYIA